jgi:hypothetical protein
MRAKLPFVSKRTAAEWKQVAIFQDKLFNRMMASDYQPVRLPYGITRLLARSTTPALIRTRVTHNARRGEKMTYREVEKMIKYARAYGAA